MYVSRHPHIFVIQMGEILLIYMPQKSKIYLNLYLLNVLSTRHRECMMVFFLGLPVYLVMDANLINVCDIKVVLSFPPLDIIPSLFCKGTIGWKKMFQLALYNSSLPLHSFSIKTGFIIKSGKGRVESR